MFGLPRRSTLHQHRVRHRTGPAVRPHVRSRRPARAIRRGRVEPPGCGPRWCSQRSPAPSCCSSERDCSSKALWRVQAVDPGFRSDGVLTLRTALPSPKYAAPWHAGTFYDRGAVRRARALPGVHRRRPTSAITRWSLPAAGSPVTAPGVADDPLSAPQAVIHFVTPGFFDTLAHPDASRPGRRAIATMRRRRSSRSSATRSPSGCGRDRIRSDGG